MMLEGEWGLDKDSVLVLKINKYSTKLIAFKTISKVFSQYAV